MRLMARKETSYSSTAPRESSWEEMPKTSSTPWTLPANQSKAAPPTRNSECSLKRQAATCQSLRSWRRSMPDFLDVLARDARATVDEGYYVHPAPIVTVSASLKNAITQSKTVPVITEIKGASPSAGTIRK